jgi:signal transduction histidine kinase
MEIHDGPLQSLGVSLMALDRALLRQGRGEQEMADRELKFLRQTLAETVSEMRQVLADLSQEVLSSYGMVVALQHHAERFTNATGIGVEVHTKVSRRLPADKELLLYRLAQEAMANARKHAEATNVVIRLEMRGGEVQLRIRDDGKGFDVDEALKRHEDGKGIGLRSMRHRIEAAGGSMRIQSAPGRGTIISFRCPVTDPTQSGTLAPLPDEA